MGALAAGARVKLLLDEHYANKIATELRTLGYDVVTVSELSLNGTTDETLLELASADHRALTTNNTRDFVTIARRWATEGRSHHGIVLTSDQRMPRGKSSIGRFARALSALMDEQSAQAALVDQVRWLP